MIFFLQADTGEIMIGHTRDAGRLDAHVRRLQKFDDRELTLLNSFAGTHTIEQRLRWKFRLSCISGKWFELSNKLIAVSEARCSQDALSLLVGYEGDDEEYEVEWSKEMRAAKTTQCPACLELIFPHDLIGRVTGLWVHVACAEAPPTEQFGVGLPISTCKYCGGTKFSESKAHRRCKAEAEARPKPAKRKPAAKPKLKIKREKRRTSKTRFLRELEEGKVIVRPMTDEEKEKYGAKR